MSKILCPKCKKGLLQFDDGASCPRCGYSESGETAANDYLTKVKGDSEYEIVKDGGVWPVYECPECEADALIHIDEDGNYVCFSCGSEISRNEIVFCCECNRPYRADPEGMSICADCFEEKININD